MIPSLSAQDAFVLFSVYDTTTGEVRRAGYVGDEESALAQAAEGEGVHLGAVLVEHYMRDGAPVPMGAKPSADHIFDWNAHEWVSKPLHELRAQRWTQIKVQRDEIEAAGFPFKGATFDSDTRSVQRINTAVQAAQAALAAGQPFSIAWTCADGSALELDAVGMLGAPVALALYANALHQTAKQMRNQIEAALTAEDIGAVTWPNPTTEGIA